VLRRRRRRRKDRARARPRYPGVEDLFRRATFLRETHPYPSWLRYCVSKVVSTSTSEHRADEGATVPAVLVRGECSFGARRRRRKEEKGGERRRRRRRRRRRKVEEEEGLFKANAVSEEDPEE